VFTVVKLALQKRQNRSRCRLRGEDVGLKNNVLDGADGRHLENMMKVRCLTMMEAVVIITVATGHITRCQRPIVKHVTVAWSVCLSWRWTHW